MDVEDIVLPADLPLERYNKLRERWTELANSHGEIRATQPKLARLMVSTYTGSQPETHFTEVKGQLTRLRLIGSLRILQSGKYPACVYDLPAKPVTGAQRWRSNWSRKKLAAKALKALWAYAAENGDGASWRIKASNGGHPGVPGPVGALYRELGAPLSEVDYAKRLLLRHGFLKLNIRGQVILARQGEELTMIDGQWMIVRSSVSS